MKPFVSASNILHINDCGYIQVSWIWKNQSLALLWRLRKDENTYTVLKNTSSENNSNNLPFSLPVTLCLAYRRIADICWYKERLRFGINRTTTANCAHTKVMVWWFEQGLLSVAALNPGFCMAGTFRAVCYRNKIST